MVNPSPRCARIVRTAVLSLILAATSVLSACSGSEPTTPAASEDTGPTSRTLTVTKAGQGTVTSDPAGIGITESGTTDSAVFTAGSIVTITASAAEGWRLADWGADCAGNADDDTTCQVAMNVDRTVDVTFEPVPVPEISVSRVALSFSAIAGTAAPAQDVTVTNAGGGVLRFSVASEPEWVSVSVDGGVLEAGASTTLAVSTTAASLDEGVYTGTVVLTDPEAANGPVEIDVSLRVDAAETPTIAVSPTSLEFSTQQNTDPNAQTFTVTNSGVGTLSFNAVEDAPWLELVGASQSIAGSESRPVEVRVVAGSLGPGTYTHQIRILGDGAANSPRTVDVAVSVFASLAPGLTVSENSMSFTSEEGGDVEGRTLRVTNTGTGTMSFTTTASSGWLQLTETSGSLDAGQFQDVGVVIDTEGLEPGEYVDTITVASEQAFNSPKTVVVTLKVTSATRTLTVTKTGSGTVTSSPAGISIPSGSTSDTGTFDNGTSVTLTATPATGWQIAGWSGSCSGTAPTCVVSMTGDRAAEVSFEEVPSGSSLPFSDTFDGPETDWRHAWQEVRATIGTVSLGIDQQELVWTRSGAGGSGQGVGLEYEPATPFAVTDNTVVRFDIQIGASTVRNGAGDANTEWGGSVRIRGETATGDPIQVVYGYGDRGGATSATVDWTHIVGHPFTPIGQWQRGEQFRLRDAIPEIAVITSIYVGGAGWDFSGRVDNLVIEDDAGAGVPVTWRE